MKRNKRNRNQQNRLSLIQNFENVSQEYRPIEYDGEHPIINLGDGRALIFRKDTKITLLDVPFMFTALELGLPIRGVLVIIDGSTAYDVETFFDQMFELIDHGQANQDAPMSHFNHIYEMACLGIQKRDYACTCHPKTIYVGTRVGGANNE